MISDRPVYKGLPVPYVTRWTGDRTTTAFRVGFQAGVLVSPLGVQTPVSKQALSYPDEREDDRALGVLWQRETETETGTPEFSQVSTPRQRRCMIDGLCQVCGVRLNPNHPYRWLLPEVQYKVVVSLGTTIAPPVCNGCFEEAPKFCPALGASAARLTVESWTPVAIQGEWAHLGEDGEVNRGRGECPLGSEYLDYHVAKQLVVRLNNWRIT